MLRRALLSTALAALTVVCTAVLWPGESRAEQAVVGPRPAVFYDAIGDAGNAADITSVAVARDATDRITFGVNVADHPKMLRGDVFQIGVDANRDGFSEVMLVFAWSSGATAPEYGVFGCRSSGAPCELLDVTAQVRYATHGLRFSVAEADLGGTDRFRFKVRTGKAFTREPGPADWAPAATDQQWYSYALGPASEIGVADRMTIPLPSLLPKAGGTLKVRGVQVHVFEHPDADTGFRVSTVYPPDKVRCAARIGSVLLAPAPGGCAWRVPATARGKELVLSVTVNYRGDEWTNVYPLEIE